MVFYWYHKYEVGVQLDHGFLKNIDLFLNKVWSRIFQVPRLIAVTSVLLNLNFSKV